MTEYGIWDYTYDWANRLIRVTCGGGILATYTYDALNRRVSDYCLGGTTKFIYDGSQVIEEYQSGSPDTLLRKFIYGTYVDDVLVMVVPSGVYVGDYYYVKDARYSVVAQRVGIVRFFVWEQLLHSGRLRLRIVPVGRPLAGLAGKQRIAVRSDRILRF